jgi:hypothetical protein
MLEHSIGRLNRGNAVQQIDVVDPYPKAALESLAGLGVPDSKIRLFEDVSQWVDDLVANDPGGQSLTVAPYGE